MTPPASTDAFDQANPAAVSPQALPVVLSPGMCARRRQPTVGTRVSVALLARRVGGSVEEVADDGRRLTVVTDEGEVMEFAISPAKGYFTAGGTQSGARLSFED